MKRKTVSLHCTCGASMKVTFKATATAQAIQRVLGSWTRDHQGDGHQLTDALTASKARRVAEAKEASNA